MRARTAQAAKPAPGTMQARSRASRAAVLAAARKLFAQQGFKSTSLIAVAQAANMTDGGLLYHFPTKTHLLLAVIEEGDQEERVTLGTLVKPGGIQAVRALGEWGAVLEQDPFLTALDVTLSAEHLIEDSEVRRYFVGRQGRIRNMVADFFHQAKVAGDLAASTQPEVEAQLLIATLDGLRLQWLLSDQKISMAQGMRAYVKRLLARLAP